MPMIRRLLPSFALIWTCCVILPSACQTSHQVSQADFLITERDEIGILLALALVEDSFQPMDMAGRRGHNIGAVIVDDRTGRIIDYGLNCNHKYNSGTQHAETRLIRKAIRRLNSEGTTEHYGSLLANHTVYTTLEPCSMCAGTMDLVNLHRVVFAQSDPTQCGIIRHLHDLHPTSAPSPSRSTLVLSRRLDVAYQGSGLSITDFLRTETARTIMREAREMLLAFHCDEPANQAFLDAAREFLTHPPVAARFLDGE